MKEQNDTHKGVIKGLKIARKQMKSQNIQMTGKEMSERRRLRKKRPERNNT